MEELLNPQEIRTLEDLAPSLKFAETMSDNGAEVRAISAEASAFLGPEGLRILGTVTEEALKNQAECQKNSGF